MSEIKGCMNCGNISCGNNKKRESAGCGRYISPEDKIKELEAKNAELTEMVEAYDRNRDRLIAMGFPHFRNCKEYAEKLKELEKKNAELKHITATLRQEKDNANMYAKAMEIVAKTRSDQLTKAKEIILRLYNAGRDVLMCRAEEKAYNNLSNAINDKSIAQFLKEIEK